MQTDTVQVHAVRSHGVEDHDPADLPALLDSPDGFVWVDMWACDDKANRMLSDIFSLHPQAVNDCVERNRVPKLHAYADHVLAVLHTPELGQRGHVHYVELVQIIGHRYLITVHGPVNPAVDARAATRETEAVLERLRAGRLMPRTPAELSHAIVSALARNLERFVEAATSDVWELEQRMTGGDIADPEEFLNDLFRTRHGLLTARTMGGLSAALYQRTDSLPELSADSARLFADLVNRFERVRSVADDEREYLQGVLEFYQTALVIKATLAGQAQTAASYQQNEEVKKISAWAAIFFAPTVVGTVYGMNFPHMPELHWVWGYPFALALMACLSLSLYAAFRRRGWL